MDISKNVEEYKERGFTKIEGFFSPEKIKEIEVEVEKYTNERRNKLSGRDINFTKNGLNSVHKLWEEGEENYFYQMAASKRLNELVRPFLDDEPEIRSSELFLKPAKEGLPSPSHQDDFYWCIEDSNALTVWTALVDCDEENGGIYYYDGSHKIGLMPHTDSFAPGSSQKVSQEPDTMGYKKIIPSLKSGDILIHHALTVHGSAANTSERSRRGWTIQYKGKNSAYDPVRQEHYLSRLQAQVQQRQQSLKNS